MKKKMMFFIILVICIINIYTCVQADTSIKDSMSGADSFISAGQSSDVVVVDKVKLKSASDSIFNILLVAGIIIAVILSPILGIKFMIGSVEEKAQVKETLIPFVIGCIVVFGAFTIWKIFVTIGANL